jgi:hypothetical protein
MSNTVPSQHPAVVLRSHYQQLRALLAIAIAVILGLTIAVVVLATNSDRTPTSAASVRQATVPSSPDALANYPDAPPPNVSTPDSLANYPDAPQP